MRHQAYRDPRPPEAFEDYHRRARTRDPDAVYDLIRLGSVALCRTVYRARAAGVGNVPEFGPVIVAANHFSNADHFFFGCFMERKLRFMAKSQLFRGPMGWVYSHGGVFPVRRGQRDEEAFKTALEILGRGGCIAIYPEGGRSRDGELGQEVRPGVGRLALASGAVVVPAAIRGSERLRRWRRLDFPRVDVAFGAPMRWEPEPEPGRKRQQQVADDVFAAVRELYAGLQVS